MFIFKRRCDATDAHEKYHGKTHEKVALMKAKDRGLRGLCLVLLASRPTRNGTGIYQPAGFYCSSPISFCLR